MAMAGGIRQGADKKRPSRTDLARVGGDVQWAGWRVSGRRAPSGRKWQGSQSSEGATELGFPGPALGQMQSEAARRAGEPSGEGAEASSEGLGGYHLLAQTDARRPASQVVGHHLDGQPGAVGGETGRPAGSAFLGHPGESPRGRIHIMTLCESPRVSIRRSTPERWMPKSGSPMRCSELSDDGVRLSSISCLDPPRDLVRPKFSNI